MSSGDASAHQVTNSQSPTVDEVMAAVAIPILEYGRAWMVDGATAERAAELGLNPGLGFWVNGRAGFLGEVDSDVAAAAIGFMSPQGVKTHWGVRNPGLSMPDLTEAYAETLGLFGQRTLADLNNADLSRLADLCHKVAAAALPSSGVLFTGWRALPRPGDPAADAAVAINILRELRGGAHLSAVHAVGIGPHGAIMSVDDPVRGGTAGAERFGWAGPHPEADADRRAQAETLTTEACRPAFDALAGDERTDFIRLVTAARATVQL